VDLKAELAVFLERSLGAAVSKLDTFMRPKFCCLIMLLAVGYWA